MNNETQLKQAKAIAKTLGYKVVRLKGEIDGATWYTVAPRGRNVTEIERMSVDGVLNKLQTLKNLVSFG